MSQGYSWAFDTPSGTYKNHALSSDLRVAAIALAKFMQFVSPEPGYGKKKGESITISRLADSPTGLDNGRISEGRRIPEDNITLTTIAITVSEWGRAIPYTSLSEDLGKFSPSNMIQRKLRDQMKLTMDIGAANAFKNAKVKAIPDGASSLVFDTDGTPSTTATDNLNVYHVERIRDYMFSTLRVPMLGDSYVCIASTKAIRGIKDDSTWEEWHKYTDPAVKFNGEVGRLEGIRFIETNHLSALSQSLGAGGVLGEAIFFGEDAVAMAVAQDPELRAGIPGDYGRQKAVAWYGILEFGIVWDTANAGEAKIVHLTSQ